MENKITVLYHLQHLSQLVFEVTDGCNLNCKYCAYSSMYEGYDKREFKKLPFGVAKTAIDYIMNTRDSSPDTNYPLTISFYGGEPLLNFSLISEVIHYIENKYSSKKVNFGMTTNAVLLDRYMDFIAANNFRLTLSLDGDEKGQSCRVDHTGKNSFKRVFRNINLLKTRYPGYFETNVMFNSVMHNMNSAESTHEFIKRNFDKTPLLSPLNPVGIKKEKIEEFNTMFQNINESVMNSSNCESLEADMFIRSPRISSLVNYIFRHSNNVYGEYNDLIFDVAGKSEQQTGTCSPFSRKMFITVNGKILQCERIGHQFALGYVTENSIHLDLDEIVEKQNKLVNKLQRLCKKCYLKKVCPQCIYNITNILDENPLCDNFCNKQQFEKLIDMPMDYLSEHPYYYEKILNEVKVQ